jgi:hypothetical protein
VFNNNQLEGERNMADEAADAGMVARSQHIAERKARARQLTPSARVRVLPRDETIRKNIVHWPTQIAFPATGSVEWPNDRFTQRRIRDGDVTIEEAAKSEAAKTESGPQRQK